MDLYTSLTYLASAAVEGEEKKDILSSLGIDWTLLLFQGIAFLILVFLLGKYVYPVFLRIIDERQDKMDEGTRAAAEAEKKAAEAEKQIEKALKQARSEATDIVATAKTEASAMVSKAETDAKKRGERIVEEAREEIDKEVIAARKTLQRDTAGLVKQAASIATAGVADSKLDTALIKKSVEEAKR